MREKLKHDSEQKTEANKMVNEQGMIHGGVSKKHGIPKGR